MACRGGSHQFLPRTVYADFRLFGNKRHNLCIGHIRILFPGILYRTNGHVILHRLIHQCLRHRAQTVNRGSILHRAVGHDSCPRELHAFKPYANAFPAHIRCNNNMEGNPLSGDQDGKHRRFHDIGHTFNYRPTLPAQACVGAIGLT